MGCQALGWVEWNKKVTIDGSVGGGGREESKNGVRHWVPGEH